MPSNKRERLTPHRIEIREKEIKALELRKAGVTWQTIADALGWDYASSAQKAVKRVLAETRTEASEELRKLEVLRLDAMLASLWPEAMRGKWLAHDRILRIMERKAMLLGLDAPQRRVVDVVTRDAFAEEMEKLTQQVKELEAGEVTDSTAEDLDEIDAELEQEFQAAEARRAEALAEEDRDAEQESAAEV